MTDDNSRTDDERSTEPSQDMTADDNSETAEDEFYRTYEVSLSGKEDIEFFLDIIYQLNADYNIIEQRNPSDD